MNRFRTVAFSLLVLASTGCFHAVIETGLPAGGQVISKPWAHSFVYGLVPPAPIDASNVCRSGVSKVETQHSFLNGLVAGLTWSLYTPIQIDITCAADRASRTPGEENEGLTARAAAQNESTIIRFERNGLRRLNATATAARVP